MVFSDTGLPDPNEPEDDLTIFSSEGIILVTEEDEDSDDQDTVVLDEYQPLSTDENADFNQETSDDEENEMVYNTASPNSAVPPITPIEDVLVRDVWSQPHPKAVDIEMDSKKVDEVKQAMSSITLPPNSIPEWAANIPEDEWKEQLIKRLQGMKEENL